MEKYKLCVLDGKNYICLDAERDENGVTPLEHELKKRIFKLKFNIEKCGSFHKLEEMGGPATQTYLKKTRNLLRHYLYQRQVEYLLTTPEDLREAADAVNKNNQIYPLIEQASMNDIEAEADRLRDSLVNSWFVRRQSQLQLCQSA